MNTEIIAQTPAPAQETPDTIPAGAFVPVDLDCWDTVPPHKAYDVWNDTPREDLHGCLQCGALVLPNTDGTIPALCPLCVPQVRYADPRGGMVFLCQSFTDRDGRSEYRVNLSGVYPACSCPDFNRHVAPAIGPRYQCKHIGWTRLAVPSLEAGLTAAATAERALRQDRIDALKVLLGLVPAPLAGKAA